MSSTKKAQRRAKLLNVNLNITSKERVLSFVEQRIKQESKFLIFTPNPEIVLQANKDQGLKEALNSVDMNLPDGVGILLMSKFLGFRGLKIIKGRQIFLNLVDLANRHEWKIFLLGGESKVAVKLSEILAQKYPKVRFKAFSGPKLTKNALPASDKDKIIEKEALRAINSFKPHLLFVAFGAPKQEKWLTKHIGKLNIGGAMAVGGTFDFLTGKAKLPPKIIEGLGLEWLWRLFWQPTRLPRIFNATIVFPLTVLKEKILVNR